MRNAECVRCDLCHVAKNVGILGDGEPGGILFVGIGPGHDEDEAGGVFVGASGRRLRLLCSQHVKVPVAFVNLVGCLPLDDRPTIEQVTACWPYYDAVKRYEPKVIVALGGLVGSYLVDGKVTKTHLSIEKSRRKLFEYAGVPLIITYHPVASLRAYGRMKHKFLSGLTEDIKWADEIVSRGVQSGEIFQPKYVSQLPQGGTWVIDIETTGLRPWDNRITHVGLADFDRPSVVTIVEKPDETFGIRA